MSTLSANDCRVLSLPSSGGGRGPLSWAVLSDLAALDAVDVPWRALAQPRAFFVGPDWTRTWLRSHAVDGIAPHLMVATDASGAIVGLFPLARLARGDLVTCGREEGVAHLDVLATAGREAEVANGVLDLLDRRGGGRVRLHRLAEGGALWRAIEARAESLHLLARSSATCPYITLDGGYEDLLRTLGKHDRHEIRRQTRRFFEHPGSEARWTERIDAVPADVATLFDLHARRSEAIERRSAFAGERRLAFHVDLARALAARGALLLLTLSDGGRPVASAYGFHHGDSSYLFQTGIDPAYRATGAGVVVRSLALEAVAGSGRRELDLLDGCYDWKARLATGVRVLVDVDLFPATAAGRSGRLLERAVRAARARAALLVKGRHCPGHAGDEPVDPRHCVRLGCPYAVREAEAERRSAAG